MTDLRSAFEAAEPFVPDPQPDQVVSGGNSGNGGYNTDNAPNSRSRRVADEVGTGGNGLPRGYSLKDGALLFADPDDDGPTVWVSSSLHVTALTRNERGEEWGRLLEFRDPDGRSHLWACPIELLAGDGVEFRRQLLSMGLRIAPGSKARNLLGVYVQACRPEARATCTGRTGWHGTAYILPDETIGGEDAERVLLQTLADPPVMAQAGDVAGWRAHIGTHCAGNSRLAFAVSMAFAAPLLHIVGAGSGGVNLAGPSSTGKTTVLRVAASVRGAPDPLRTWRATANGLEGVASLHNDGLLVLDELGEIDPREAGAAAYMLANGVGKARARRDGLARPAAAWRLLFLSSGEIGLADHMREGGKRARPGQEVRLADLPADAGVGHGVFEQLHGHADGAALAGALLDATRRYHGTVGRAYLRRLVELDPELVRSGISELQRDFITDVLATGADGQARRVADRFALIAAGGALATRFGLTGWSEGEAVAAANTCYRAWLDRRGGTGSAEDAAALAAVDHFIELHGASRFAWLGDGGETEQRTVVNRAGNVRTVDGRRQYLFLPETFRSDVCAGLDYRRVLDALKARGRFMPGDGNHLAMQVRGVGRCYAIWEAGDES